MIRAEDIADRVLLGDLKPTYDPIERKIKLTIRNSLERSSITLGTDVNKALAKSFFQ